MFLSIDRHDPAAVALVDGDSGLAVTYGALVQRVRDVAAALAGGKRLALCLCRNDVPTILGYLAAVEAGCAVALIDAAAPVETRERLVDLYDPEFILGDGGSPDDERHGVRSRSRDTRGGAIHAELALLLTTSGSTGSPKLVRLTRASVEHNAWAIAQALALDAAERAITSLPVHYSYGLSVVNSHLLAGATVVVTGLSIGTRPFWDVFREQRCTSFAGVPYSYQMLRRLNVDRLDVPTLRTLTQAGGKLDAALVTEFADVMRRRNGRFFVMYGQTEATARIAVLPAGEVHRKPASAGLPLPGGRFEIADGELIYHGPNVMSGYAETRADLARGDEFGGRLPTGDQGYLDDEGYLYITGRSKRIAKVFGNRINLEDVEAALATRGPAAAVNDGERIVVFCEFGDAAELDACRAHLGERLRLHRSAFDVRRENALPRNANGKLDYAALLDRARVQR